MQKGVFTIHQQKFAQKVEEKESIERIHKYLPQLYCLPEGYSSCPSPQQLFWNGGKCKNLIIISPFGRIEWEGQIDISTLEYPLSQTVLMDEGQLEVYINGRSTPARGKQLNRPCRATFTTSAPFTYSSLQQLCLINETELVDCNIESGNFSVMIPHFTKYSFNQLNEPDKKNKSNPELLKKPQNLSGLQWQKQSTLSKSHVSSIGGDSLSVQREKLAKQRKQNKSSIRQQKDSQNSLSGQNVINNLLNLIKKKQDGQQETKAQQTQFKIFEAISGMIQDKQTIEESEPVKLTSPKDISQIIADQNYYREHYGYSLLPKSSKQSLILSGTFSCHVGVANCRSYKMKLGTIVEGIQIILPVQRQIEYSQYSFLDLALKNTAFNADSVANIALDQRYPFKVRRFFSLYSILFLEDNVLQFYRDDALNFSLKKANKTPNNNTLSRQQRIKKWFAWTCYQQFNGNLQNSNIFQTNSLIMQQLALRKPQLTIQHFYVDGRWDDGEFITRIQDADYRAYVATEKNINLCQELAMIAKENYEQLASKIHSWLVYLSFAAWYFKKQSFQQTLLNAIQKAPRGKLDSFHEETRLLQLYIAKNIKRTFKSPLICPKLHAINIQQLSCYYLISNCLGLQQVQRSTQESYHSSKKMYKFYRYQILQQIIQKSPINVEGINELIERDHYFQQSDKDLLLKKWAVKYNNNDNQFHRNKIIQKQADSLINKGLLIDGLAKLFQIQSWDWKLKQKVYSLATLPQLLTHFKRSVNFSVNAILIQRKEQFSDLLLILKLGRKQFLTRNQSIRILHILQGKSKIEKYLNPSVKGFIKDGVQKLILHSIVERNQFLAYLSSNSQQREFINKAFKHTLHLFNRMEEVIQSL